MLNSLCDSDEALLLCREVQEVKMPRKKSDQPYKPKVEYKYTLKDIAELAGMTRNALNVRKFHGQVNPGDFKSVVNFLTRRIIDQRLAGDLFASATRGVKRGRRSRSRSQVSGKRPQKTARRRQRPLAEMEIFRSCFLMRHFSSKLMRWQSGSSSRNNIRIWSLQDKRAVSISDDLNRSASFSLQN